MKRKSFSQADPDEKPKQARRRTDVLGTPTDSESATPSINPAVGANSDTSTPAEASPVTRRLSNQHQNQFQTSKEKNRVAASKCRKKKKEEEKNLLERKEMLELQRTILESTKKELEDEVLTLKSMILQHGTCNFPPIQDYIQTAASRLQALAPNIFAPIG
ncbi:hypothetical protein E8E14_004991 [Neopestalotiopsis sp. 37M]|nr:hypothetical protein E8E14_004991 [Neopestalotiopsis sp. 37M]